MKLRHGLSLFAAVFAVGVGEVLAQQRETLLGPPTYLANTSVELDVNREVRLLVNATARHREYRPGRAGPTEGNSIAIRPSPVARARGFAEAGVLPGRLSTVAQVDGGIPFDAANLNPFMRAEATSSVTRFWRFESNDPAATTADLDFLFALTGEHLIARLGVRNAAPGSSTTRFRLDVLDENFNTVQTPIRLQLRMIHPYDPPTGSQRTFFFVDTFGSLVDETSLRSNITISEPILEGSFLVTPAQAEVASLQRSTSSISVPLDTPVGLRWTLESQAELVHNLNVINPQSIFDSEIYSNFGRTVYLDSDADGNLVSTSGFGFELAGGSIGSVGFSEVLVVPEPGSVALLALATGVGFRRRRPQRS